MYVFSRLVSELNIPLVIRQCYVPIYVKVLSLSELFQIFVVSVNKSC